jgi:hypothetical protein
MMEFVNGKDDIPYMKWTIKAMFETTNQYIFGITMGILNSNGYFVPASRKTRRGIGFFRRRI